MNKSRSMWFAAASFTVLLASHEVTAAPAAPVKTSPAPTKPPADAARGKSSRPVPGKAASTSASPAPETSANAAPIEVLKARQARIPLGFMGDGTDTANAILFLCSDEARFITGTEIVVDGGMTVRCA